MFMNILSAIINIFSCF